MKVLSVLSQKGGAGKTTLAIHLAALAHTEGERALMVDLDPQRSAGDWWRARSGDEPPLIEIEAPKLGEVLAVAEGDGITLVVVDTAPHSEAAAVAAAKAADLVVIPVRPSILDLRAVRATVDIAAGLGRPAAFVLNSCPAGRGLFDAPLVTEARKALSAYGLPVAPRAIVQRAALAHALIDGRAVHEFEPEGKAAGELRDLWQWLKEMMR